MLATIPDTVSKYLYDDPGKKVTVLKEAFQLRRNTSRNQEILDTLEPNI